MRAHHCAFSPGLLNLFPINHSSGRGLHAAEPNDVQWPFWPRYGDWFILFAGCFAAIALAFLLV